MLNSTKLIYSEDHDSSHLFLMEISQENLEELQTEGLYFF